MQLVFTSPIEFQRSLVLSRVLIGTIHYVFEKNLLSETLKKYASLDHDRNHSYGLLELSLMLSFRKTLCTCKFQMLQFEDDTDLS